MRARDKEIVLHASTNGAPTSDLILATVRQLRANPLTDATWLPEGLLKR